MTGLDTNLLVRYIIRDDPAQTRKATRIIEEQLSVDEPGFVSVVSLVEMVWVLESSYGLSAQQLGEAVRTVLQIETLSIQNQREVYSAMLAQKSGQGSFADALIGSLGLWAGCTSTLTFDKRASRLPGFELIA